MTPDTPQGDSQRDSATITEAARLLGVSVRTVQRRLDNGDLRAIERDGKRLVDMTPDATSDVTQGDNVSRHDATRDTTGDGSTPALLDQLKDENAFLRAQVDAWRLQAEAANRTASETAAALREALKAMPKALPDVSTQAANPTPLKKEEADPQRDAQAPKPSTPRDAISATNAGASRRKVKPWQRAIMRMIGARE
jgi:excisionase family DNA binding protein